MSLSAINSAHSLWSTYQIQTQQSDQLAAQKPETNAAQQAPSIAPVVQTQAPEQVANTATTANALPQQENLSYSQQMEQMASPAAGTAMAVSTNTKLPELYKFDNQYLYGTSTNTWAKIDTDQDGMWGKPELQAYADAYYKATGIALDVDDLLDTYGVDNGMGDKVIDYYGQNRMYQDDALGISYVKDEILRAEMGQNNGSGSSPVNQKALDAFVDKYTYGSPGRLYAKVDQDDDGLWTLSELKEYAKAWERATGEKMDAEALFAKYDRDGSGVLTYAEINEMYKDDALGLSKISDMMKAQEIEKGADKGETGKTGQSGRLYDTLMDMWGSKFSSSELRSLASAFTQGMQKAAMLDAFMFTNNYIATGPGWGRYGGFSYGYGSNTAQMAGNISMLNMFV